LIQELFLRGKFREAADVIEERLKRGILRADDDRLALEIGEHPGALSHAVASWSYLVLGNIEQSKESMNEAVRLAKLSNHAYSIANSGAMESVLYNEFGDIRKSHSSAAECIAYGEKHENTVFAAFGYLLKGLCECQLGGGIDSIASVRQGLANW